MTQQLSIPPQETERFPIKALFEMPAVKEKFTAMLGDRSTAFITTVLQIVNSSDMLKRADPQSVYSAAMTAATLNLPVNPNLGFAYIIPYNDRSSGKAVAQFQLGYRGLIQLAQRSGVFRTINVSDVREGEIKNFDRLSGMIDFSWINEGREKLKVVGYVSFFSLLNGFEKPLYMSIEELQEHGMRYSRSFAKGYGLWKDDFDSMARKTVLKLLLARFAPLSVDMQKAVISDQAVILDPDNDQVVYVDNDEVIDVTVEMLIDAYEQKKDALSKEDSEDIKRIIDQHEVKSFAKALKHLNHLVVKQKGRKHGA